MPDGVTGKMIKNTGDGHITVRGVPSALRVCILGREEGDGVPHGAGGAKGGARERGEIVRFDWHQKQGDPCTPLPPSNETYLTGDIQLNLREPIGRPGLLGMTGISTNSQGFKPIRLPQWGE
jgi:hypothetical protein